MKRIGIVSLIVVAICAAVGFAIDGLPKGPNANKPKYWAELDNAFGLITGGDLKIAGVRAGKITDLKLDKKNLKALVGFQITQDGFGDLRADATCESRPQSLIGEYFLDCEPGHSPRKLRNGAVIPLSHTASTIPPDLVNDIMRLPERQRLSIIVDSLGAGVAGNGQALNSALHRAVPALRETDQVLAILARQNKVITDLNVNADTILRSLAANKRDVSRWVTNTRNISRDTAAREAAFAQGWHLLPGFLEQLRPTLKTLGVTADAQTASLQNLVGPAGRTAKQLTKFFDLLGPFSDASRPAVRALGRASTTGSQAVKTATPTVQLLNQFSTGTPELASNLAIVLQHLDDRKYAVEDDKRAAQQQGVSGPSGYSGLEALLQYVMDVTWATNIYDANTHLLSVSAFQGGGCSNYSDAQDVKTNPSLKNCLVNLGPNQPGINFTDPSAGTAPSTGRSQPTAAQRAAHANAVRTRPASAKAATSGGMGQVLNYLLGP